MAAGRRLVVATSALAVAGISGTAYAASAAKRALKPARVPVRAPVEPEAIADEPDALISARATNGMLGFVRTTDLETKPLAHPETTGMSTSLNRLIPVYGGDGTTVIGKYLIESGAASPAPIHKI